MNEGKSDLSGITNEFSLPGMQLLKAISEVSKECDHRAFYRVTGGAYVAIRYCSNCGKSWRMFVRADYPSEFPPEWEEIKEPMEEE